MISKKDIKEMAELSMLKFTDEEVDILEERLRRSLDRMEVLKSLDVENVEALYQIHEDIEEFREDSLEEDYLLSKEEVLQNTSEQQYGYFKLLNIMD